MNRPAVPNRDRLQRLRRRSLDGSRWRAAFTRNLPLKALSLVIAIALWAFVNFGERDTEASFKAPLELRNIPTGLAIVGPRYDDIDVRLIGPRTLLGRVDRANMAIHLDLQGARPGPAVFTIGPERLDLPRGIRLVRITPAQITLDLERISSKSVPVQLRIENRPVSDFTIGATGVSPDRVTITGPVSVLRDVEFVSTEPLDMSRATRGNVEQDLRLLPIGEGTSLDIGSVTASVRIEDVVVTRTFDSVPVELRAPRGQVRIRPSSVVLTVEGPQRLIRTLALESAIAWVDVPDQGPGTFAAEPMIVLPEGVRAVSVVPRQVEVIFSTATSPLG